MEQDTQAISAAKAEAKPTEKKFNLQEKIDLCKQWYSSGLRKAEFARKHRIKPELFTHWTNDLIQQYLPENALHERLSSKKTIALNNTWIPIAAKAHQETSMHGAPLIEATVALPQGISLILKLNIQQLQDLIRGFDNGISTQ